MASLMSSSLFLFLLFLTISSSLALDHIVGGFAGAWKIPSPSTSQSLNKWAESTRFQVGDALVWKFDGEKDSVLQVTREAYLSCNTTSPVKEHKDGNSTKVRLRRPGAYYFISGAKGACQEGEKLIVVVMSPRHAFAPAPAPMEYDGPAAAPTSGASVLAVLGRGGLVAVLGLVVGMERYLVF